MSSTAAPRGRSATGRRRNSTTTVPRGTTNEHFRTDSWRRDRPQRPHLDAAQHRPAPQHRDQGGVQDDRVLSSYVAVLVGILIAGDSHRAQPRPDGYVRRAQGLALRRRSSPSATWSPAGWPSPAAASPTTPTAATGSPRSRVRTIWCGPGGRRHGPPAARARSSASRRRLTLGDHGACRAVIAPLDCRRYRPEIRRCAIP